MRWKAASGAMACAGPERRRRQKAGSEAQRNGPGGCTIAGHGHVIIGHGVTPAMACARERRAFSLSRPAVTGGRAPRWG